MIIDAGVRPETFEGVTCFETGSAPVDPALVDEFERLYGLPVLAAYGATEFRAAVAAWNLDDHAHFACEKRGSVGRAVAGFGLRVVDDGGEPLPAGEQGRLEVLPRGADAVTGWVPTTDCASIDGDGFLFVHGRLDDVIIRGGFKVPAGEVQQVLEAHAAVAEATVIGLPDLRLGEVPVAAVVLSSDVAAPTPEELVAWSRDRLVPYKVPTRILVLDALPRNAMMKVVRADVLAAFGERP